MAVRNIPAFSYPLPVLVRVLSNLLIIKQNLPDYNKYSERRVQKQMKTKFSELIMPSAACLNPKTVSLILHIFAPDSF